MICFILSLEDGLLGFINQFQIIFNPFFHLRPYCRQHNHIYSPFYGILDSLFYLCNIKQRKFQIFRNINQNIDIT